MLSGTLLASVCVVDLVAGRVERVNARVVAMNTVARRTSTEAWCAARVSFVPHGGAEPIEVEAYAPGACGEPCSRPDACHPATLRVCYAVRDPEDAAAAVDPDLLCAPFVRTGTIVAICVCSAWIGVGALILACEHAEAATRRRLRCVVTDDRTERTRLVGDAAAGGSVV